MKLSLGEYGAMVTEALTTGSGEQAGPRGALRQSPKGTSGGKQIERLASSALLSCQETHSPFQSQRLERARTTGPHGSSLRELPAHAGMFFYFSC